MAVLMNQWDGMLWHAAKDNDLKRAAEAIARGANVNVMGSGQTPLHRAAYFGHLDFCRLLVAAGAGVSIASDSERGGTALHDIVGWGVEIRPEIVRFLLEQGANPNSNEATDERCPLHMVAEQAKPGVEEVIRLLIAAGANPNAVTVSGLTPLKLASVRAETFPSVRLLVYMGADPGYVPQNPAPDYLTPFQFALSRGNAPVVDFYIAECGQTLDQETFDGRSMLQLVEDRPKGLGLLLSLQTKHAMERAIPEEQPSSRMSRQSGMAPL